MTILFPIAISPVTSMFLTLSKTSPAFHMSATEVFENTVGKGEIARNEQFLLFTTVFSNHFENFLLFQIKFEFVICRPFQFGRV